MDNKYYSLLKLFIFIMLSPIWLPPCLLFLIIMPIDELDDECYHMEWE